MNFVGYAPILGHKTMPLYTLHLYAANQSDEESESDETLEETRRKMAQNRRRTKLDLTAGLTDLSTGNVDNLVLQFIEKLKVSNAETRLKSGEEQVGDTDGDKDARK